jgi:FkbM family methyltransferase
MLQSIDTRPNLGTLLSLIRALSSPQVKLVGMRLYVPGTLPIRLSVVMGNLRMHRLLDTMLRAGDRVVDVGANIGYNALYAARCVGPSGRVVALEPAQDNLAILYANLFANRILNVDVLPYAAGNMRALKRFFLRGNISAVNSLYEDNFYHPITNTVEVLTERLDDLIGEAPNLIKIDVEGGELDVLAGMTRLLRSPTMHLIVEWHPTLQQAAGHAADALPKYLMQHGYRLTVVTHTSSSSLELDELPHITSPLLHKRNPVELVAIR